MADALSVARELVRLSLAGPEPDPLTNLRLQKLLYFSQAWSLALRSANLFPEDLLAAGHGPLVRRVFKALHHAPGAVILKHKDLDKTHTLEDEESHLVRAVWDTYRRYSASQLAEMIHDEAPWRAARAGLPEDDKSSPIIDDEALADSFERRPTPAPLAAYKEHLRRAEKEAREAVPELAKFDEEAFIRSAIKPRPRTATARKRP